MKIIIRIIGTLLAIVKLSTASGLTSADPYLTTNIQEDVKKISLSKLLDFKKISVAIEDEFDRARFHYIIAYDIIPKTRGVRITSQHFSVWISDTPNNKIFIWSSNRIFILRW